ncbi:ABC transporter substrate-binding protein [Pandoraea sp. CB10b_02]|uniref:ABC transporter substrate-binding protein n=1 Tax=Pandoraea sp. CB10b_02 TaxID=2014535 RepID=UPI00257D440B|nr:ABC transporter substrate-binding protein [Pandoraea sp. CB10b_02]
MTQDASLIAAFAPTGVLRACINLGNPVLAGRDAQSRPIGISVDLAAALAQRLGVALEPIVVDTAARAVETVSAGDADVGFFAVDPRRATAIAFTEPYLLIEGYYLVPKCSPVQTNADVDRSGTRVVVGKGSAYDLFLTRELQHAEIVRAPTSPAVVRTFLDGGYEVAAGVKQQLEADIQGTPGYRLLGERFMVIRQAMGLPIGRGEAAAKYLATFVDEMKTSGYVAQALQRHRISGVSVAP